MQIDLDYLKRLLEAFAAAPGPLTDIQELEGRGVPYQDPQFVFHMEILDDERLVARDDRAPGFGLIRGGDGTEMWSVLPLRLTADGHKFLEGLRDPRIWDTINRKFKTAGIATLVTASKTLLESYTKEARESVRATGCLHKVFIVHGHDDGTKQTVARFVEQLGLEAVILHERPNKGRTIITKFREESEDIGFAIVLMTPDDVGKAAGAPDLNSRARQNVVFELGFFIGTLQPAHVVAIVRGDIERPSDFDGVVYITFDRPDWRMELAKELRAAGFYIDLKALA